MRESYMNMIKKQNSETIIKILTDKIERLEERICLYEECINQFISSLEELK